MGERILGGGGIAHERLAQAGNQQGSSHASPRSGEVHARARLLQPVHEAFERLAGRAVDQRHVGEIEDEHLRVLADAVEHAADGGRGAEEKCPADAIDHDTGLERIGIISGAGRAGRIGDVVRHQALSGLHLHRLGHAVQEEESAERDTGGNRDREILEDGQQERDQETAASPREVRSSARNSSFSTMFQATMASTAPRLASGM